MKPILRFALMGLLGLSACGDKIGDECVANSDCSQVEARFCDNTQQDGYCTIVGCDWNTCPEEATCVRFFSGGFANRPCDPLTEDLSSDACGYEEACGLAGYCVPRAAETRYCMLTCESNEDCRSGYECRDGELARLHGGAPVFAPGTNRSEVAPKFCAMAPAS